MQTFLGGHTFLFIPLKGFSEYHYEIINEQDKLIWFQTQIENITIQDREVNYFESEQEIRSELVTKLSETKEKVASAKMEMLSHTQQEQLWDKIKDILSKCQEYLISVGRLRCPKILL